MDATLAKAPFALELAEQWIASEDPVRRRCGYGLLSEISKWTKRSAPDESVFLAHIGRIDKTHAKQSIPILMAMGGALLGMGTRSRKLHAAALRVAGKIGTIDFDPDGRCEPMDVAKHLSHELVRKRLGL